MARKPIWIRVAVCSASIVGGATLAAQAPDPSGRLEGSVVDALAQPLPMAEVWIVDEEEKVLARTIADGAGVFVFGKLPESAYWRVRATAPGRIEATAFARPRDGIATTSLRLWDAAALTGRVLDPDGAPIASAEVVAVFDLSRVLSSSDATSVRTDAEGRFRFAKAPLGVLDVRATAPGFLVGERRIHLTTDSACDVSLARGEGLTIEVAVEGLGEADLAAASVRLRPYASHGSVTLPPSLLRGRFDANGTWRMTGLPKYRYLVSPSLRGTEFQPRDVELFAQHGGPMLGLGASPTEGNTGRAVFKVFRRKSVVLTGRLVDARGEGLAGKMIVTRAANSGGEETAITGADGSFSITSSHAPGVDAVFSLRDPQWVTDQAPSDTSRYDARLLLWHREKVDPQRPLIIRAIRASTIRGRLVDADGQPVRFVRVTVEESMPNRMPYWMPLRSTDSRADGSFELSVHAMAEPMRIMVAGAAGWATSAEFATDPGSRHDVGDLKLAPTACIAGVVRGIDQKPVPGARVWLRDWDLDAGQQRSGSVVEVLTDRDGRYRFTGVPLGGAWLQVMLFQEHDLRRAVEPFDVTAGADLTFDLVLSERDRAGPSRRRP